MEIFISFIIVLVTLYAIFCLLLTTIDVPDSKGNMHGAKYQFITKPSGFIQHSRCIGYLIYTLFLGAILTWSTYIIFFWSE